MHSPYGLRQGYNYVVDRSTVDIKILSSTHLHPTGVDTKRNHRRAGWTQTGKRPPQHQPPVFLLQSIVRIVLCTCAGLRTAWHNGLVFFVPSRTRKQRATSCPPLYVTLVEKRWTVEQDEADMRPATATRRLDGNRSGKEEGEAMKTECRSQKKSEAQKTEFRSKTKLRRQKLKGDGSGSSLSFFHFFIFLHDVL